MGVTRGSRYKGLSDGRPPGRKKNDFSRGFFGWELWKFYEIKKSWDFDWNSVGFLMFLTVYEYVSISIYIYLYLSISIHIYLYLSTSISIYIYPYLSISIYIYLSI